MVVELTYAISQIGFAGAIAAYLVFWVTKKLDEKICNLINKIDELIHEQKQFNHQVSRLINSLLESKRGGGLNGRIL